MTPHDPLVVAALAGVGLVAGVIDGVAGGGGLLTLPALLAAGVPTTAALATNKGQAVFGTGSALIRYSRTPLFDRARARWAMPAAALASITGTTLILHLPPTVQRSIAIAAMIAVATLVALKRDHAHAPRARPAWLAALVVLPIGFYDGFIGPGTGPILITAFAFVWGEQLSAASANAKAANFASNAASLALFAFAGEVDWRLAAPMAAAQACGGWLGAHLVVRRGRALVRRLVIAMSLALVARVVWQMHAG